ncbi:MAG: carboxymuconolactone decarboxylase family protein [Phycisphaerales bacterium]|nr:MAG: carboxymuconolactone decarboxylase family protein [Phycisphaerales bacterium]
MDIRIKELIAIGASITANCKPCLEYHVAKAKENGATDQEVAEAVAVGKMVRKGAASKMDQFASAVLAGTDASQGASDGSC